MKLLFYCQTCKSIMFLESNKCPKCNHKLKPLKDNDLLICEKCDHPYTMSDVFKRKTTAPVLCENSTCKGHIIMDADKKVRPPVAEYKETVIGGPKVEITKYKMKDHQGLNNEDILQNEEKYYKIIAKINEGGLSYIFLAQDLQINEQIIVKAFKYGKYWNQETKTNDCEKFWLRESNITSLQSAGPSKCMHYYGNLKITDFDPAEYYLFLEYVPGENLQKWMTAKFGTQKQIPPSIVIELIEKIGLPLLKHLEYCHNHGIIHRDISPQNILVVPKSLNDFYSVLIDWGVSKKCAQEKIFCPSKNYLEIAGTATSINNRFTAPENRLGLEPVAATDIYMMGVIFYFLFTNSFPKEYPETTAEYTVHPQCINKSIPKELVSLVEKMTQHRPVERFCNMKDVISAFENFLLKAKKEDDVKTVKTASKQTLEASNPAITAKVHTNFAIVIDFYQTQVYKWEKTYNQNILKFVNFGYQCVEVSNINGKGFEYFIFHALQKGVTNVQINCVDDSKKTMKKFQYIITID